MWLVWRAGSPDPSRPRPAIHFDDPAKDRSRDGHLAVIAIAPAHRELRLRELLQLDAYQLPKQLAAAAPSEPVTVLAKETQHG